LTDRIHSLTVVLAEDLRDDAELLARTIDAIKLLPTVLDVTTHVSSGGLVEGMRADAKWRRRIAGLLDEVPD
jgi:hypothetical protein